MHGCEAGANRGKGGERESVHVELFFQSRVQVCLKNLGFLGGARALLFIPPLSLPSPPSLSLWNELNKKEKSTREERKRGRHRGIFLFRWENVIEARLESGQRKRIKISIESLRFSFVSLDYD